MHTFTVGGTVSSAWETFKKRAWFFIGVTALTMIIGWAISFTGGLIQGALAAGGAESLGGIISFVLTFALQTLLGMGTIALFLKAHESPERAEVSQLWHPQRFWTYLATTILLGLIIFGGMILLIVPGIIFALMFQFATYVVIDRGLGSIDALKESLRITRGKKWTLFLLALAIVGINILGFIALLVGLLVSIPVTALAMVHAYRVLEHGASEMKAA
ncbi:DUF975 family protein [Candidatus Kaiserbacteria bacterium]|nr:DUF975 family protein [Candidatus Kaiserbacteria bacterium]